MTAEQLDLILNAFKPLYFASGVVCGLLTMNLFKGRWFV